MLSGSKSTPISGSTNGVAIEVVRGNRSCSYEEGETDMDIVDRERMATTVVIFYCSSRNNSEELKEAKQRNEFERPQENRCGFSYSLLRL